MKHTTLATALFVALIALFAAPPAQAVKGRPFAISFVETGTGRQIYAFVKGDNNGLVSNHFNGTSWTWMDHGLPPGATSISNPRAVTYIDDLGKRRIYVFAIDNNGQLVVRFHKGAGYNWQWSQQGGPFIHAGSLSATTFPDDNGVRRIEVYGIRSNPSGPIPYRLVRHFWNGNSWNWADMPAVEDQPFRYSFTQVINYIGNDGRRRMDVYCKAGPTHDLLKYSWVAAQWKVDSQRGYGDVEDNASVATFTLTSGERRVHLFSKDGTLHWWWENWQNYWHTVGFPEPLAGAQQGYMSAIAYQDGSGTPHMNLFVENNNRLYLRRWVEDDWSPWEDLGLPSSLPSGSVGYPMAITYQDGRGGSQHVWVFATGSQGHMYANFWNGTSWQWYDRGSGP
ncbi:MAG: hypothetical protein ABI821_17445 [Pseudomonadota bacterium]